MSNIVNQWQFSVTVEGLKLTNVGNTYTTYFLKRYVSFIAESDTILTINNLATNNLIKINRNDCVIPSPGIDMSTFLDSLAILASA